MTDRPIFLVELTWLDANGVAQVYRASSGSAFMTRPNEVPANAVYEPRLINGGSYERHCWQRAATRGTSQIGFGVVSLANGDGALDWMMAAGVDGQPIVIRKGPENGSYPADFPPYFTGTMRRVAPQWNQVDVYLTDLWGDVGQKSYQQTKFAGSNALPNGLEGLPTDIMGKPKPKLRGTAVNFAPPCVNTSLLIYQLDDGTAKLPLTISGGSGPRRYGAFDRRSDLTFDGAVTLATLTSTTSGPPAGHFTSYAGPEGWYIRLGSQPSKLTVTASEGAATDRTVAQIVSRILSNEGGVPLANIAGISALDAAAPQEVGIWVGDETTLQPLIDSINDSVNAYCTDTRAGGFQLGQFVDPATLPAAITIQPWMIKDAAGPKIYGISDPGVGILISAAVNGSQDRYLNNQDATTGLPCWRVKLLYDRNFTVMAGADVAGAAMADVAYTSLEYRTAPLIEGQTQASSVLVQHKNAPEFTCTTLLCQEADALTEGTRQENLRRRSPYVIEIPLDPYSPLDPNDPTATINKADLGKGVMVQLPRFGMNAGRMHLCIGMLEDAGDATTAAISTLLLLGFAQ